MLLLTEIKEGCAMAGTALVTHKLRSSLTLVGITIGVFSIIVAMTAMRVLKNNVERELSQLGSHTFSIQKWPVLPIGNQGSFERIWRRKNITLNMARQVQARAVLPAHIGLESYYWRGEVQSRQERTPPDVVLIGETPGSFPAKNWFIGEGRALIESDVEHSRDVCVLGSGVAKTLFPFSSPIGDRVKADGAAYTVVGVLESKGALLGSDQDNFILIPITTGKKRYARPWQTINILVQARSQDLYEETVEEMRGIMRSLRKVPPGDEDDFELFSNESLIGQFEKITLAVRMGVGLVSSIALLAAGIGIMNIMLVSVTERTREIGIRRAVGARKRSILVQFILEAIVLCQVGGIAGVILGVLGGNATALVLKLPPAIPWDWAILGLGICSMVGLIFGTYPAIKAANLDPIESLRYE